MPKAPPPVTPILGRPDHPGKAMLRQVHFEAFSIMAEDVRRRASCQEDDERPRKLPPLERAERLKLVKEFFV